MKLYQKILGIGTLIMGLNGCVESKTLEGTVIEEFGTANRIVESSGALFGNESVKIGDPTYGLILDGNDGEWYTLSILNCENKSVYALAKAIKPGDKVRIEYKYLSGNSNPIDVDGIGNVCGRSVKLIKKKK